MKQNKAVGRRVETQRDESKVQGDECRWRTVQKEAITSVKSKTLETTPRCRLGLGGMSSFSFFFLEISVYFQTGFRVRQYSVSAKVSVFLLVAKKSKDIDTY